MLDCSVLLVLGSRLAIAFGSRRIHIKEGR